LELWIIAREKEDSRNTQQNKTHLKILKEYGVIIIEDILITRKLNDIQVMINLKYGLP